MKKRFFKFIISLCLTAAVADFLPAMAEAQTSISRRQALQEQIQFNSELENGKDVSFAQVLADPDNLQLNMAYAKTQIRHGDLKGASGTLERMLRINPKLHELRLFYAAVLYRLDNIAEAKMELQKLEGIKLPEKAVKEKNELTRLIAIREKTYTLNAQISAGIVQDSNRNSFPEDETIVYPNGATLTFEGEEKKDKSTIGIAAVNFERKTGMYGQNSFFLGGSYYMSKQDKLTDLDMGIMTLNGGFRMTGRTSMLTPQIVYSTLKLDGDSYLDSYGGSLKLDKLLNKKNIAYAEARYLKQDYLNSASHQDNKSRSGGTYGGSIGLKHIINAGMTFELEGSALVKDADMDSYDTNTYGLTARHFWLLGKNTYLLSSLSASQEAYSKAPETIYEILVSQGKKRKDTVIRGSLTFGMPVYKSLSLTLAYEYYSNDSNIQIYEYTNHKMTGMLNWKFSM